MPVQHELSVGCGILHFPARSEGRTLVGDEIQGEVVVAQVERQTHVVPEFRELKQGQRQFGRCCPPIWRSDLWKAVPLHDSFVRVPLHLLSPAVV